MLARLLDQTSDRMTHSLVDSLPSLLEADREHHFDQRRDMAQLVDRIIDLKSESQPALLQRFQEQIHYAAANIAHSPYSELLLSSVMDQIAIRRSPWMMTQLIEMIPDYLGHFVPSQQTGSADQRQPIEQSDAPRWCQEPFQERIVSFYQTVCLRPLLLGEHFKQNYQMHKMLAALFDRIASYSQNCLYLLGLPDCSSRLHLIQLLLRDYQAGLVILDPHGLFRIACSHNVEIATCLEIDPSALSEIQYHLASVVKMIMSHENSPPISDLLAMISDANALRHLQRLPIQQHDHQLLADILGDHSKRASANNAIGGVYTEVEPLARYTRDHDLPVYYYLLHDDQVMLVHRPRETLADRQATILYDFAGINIHSTHITYQGNAIVVVCGRHQELLPEAEIIATYQRLEKNHWVALF